MKYIYDDSADPQITTLPSIQTLIDEGYVVLTPAILHGVAAPEKNSFISVQIEDITFNGVDGNQRIIGGIFIATDPEHYLLSDTRLRLLEAANEVLKYNHCKLSCSGEIDFTETVQIMSSARLCTYKIGFEISDLQFEKGDNF